MKAMVFTGSEGVKLQTIADPVLEDQQSAIVKVSQCSICGSDSQFYHGINIASEDSHFCVGHETIGEVAEVGREVKHRKVGDKVLLSGFVPTPCGNCAQCHALNPGACQFHGMRIYGNSHDLPGGQAEGIAVPQADLNATPIPEGVSDDQALLLTDTLCTAYMACHNAEIRPGSTVAVIGLGPIGLMAVELAFIFGAAQVFAIDPIEHRRQLAADLGAAPLHPDQTMASIVEATGSKLVPHVVDCAGVEATIHLAINIAAVRGVISCVGIGHNPNIEFPQLLTLSKSITFRPAVTFVPGMWPALIPLLQHGRIKPQRVFSHRLSLDEGEQAYKLFMERKDNTVKVVMEP